MLDQYLTPEAFQKYGVAGGSLFVLVFFAQKAMKAWKIVDAETSVVSTMSEELKRLSAHNISLMNRLAEFQNELISVKRVIIEMTSENESLKGQVTALTEKVSTLNKTLENQKDR